MPMICFFHIKGVWLSGSSLKVDSGLPIKIDFATPIVDVFNKAPIWLAIPSALSTYNFRIN